jgi:hypothetical protein
VRIPRGAALHASFIRTSLDWIDSPGTYLGNRIGRAKDDIEQERDFGDVRSQPLYAAVPATHGQQAVAIGIITLGKFAEGFSDPRELVEFLAPFRVVQLSRAIAFAHGSTAKFALSQTQRERRVDRGKCTVLRGNPGRSRERF